MKSRSKKNFVLFFVKHFSNENFRIKKNKNNIFELYYENSVKLLVKNYENFFYILNNLS